MTAVSKVVSRATEAEARSKPFENVFTAAVYAARGEVLLRLRVTARACPQKKRSIGNSSMDTNLNLLRPAVLNSELIPVLLCPLIRNS
jgi:hypothetical protein